MNVGMIGLGRMGQGIAARLIKAGHSIVGFDPTPQAQEDAQQIGVTIAATLEHLAQSVRIFWLMIPAGQLIDTTIAQLLPHLQPEDCIVDGGNSLFHDSIRRAAMLAEKNIHFLDCGTSGGLAGRDLGYSLMIGGNSDIFKKIEPIFKAIATHNGYGLVGGAGAGHYVKMVHNGIEYSLLQAYAEGFHLLKSGHYQNLDLEQISNIWMNGSIIRSWILTLAHNVFEHDQNFENISGHVGENQTGRWTLDEAAKQNIPMTLLEDALKIRAWSRETGGNYATKVVAMLRNQFGGHTTKEKE
ncbi:decarboxylating 6-phosphogluconate dehydrogenase [Candidatus Babeliales bacterium]|nr:decarboxylating 6-phosphogluconate dehydrogenase [Candidatus Babeliales bacterium]